MARSEPAAALPPSTRTTRRVALTLTCEPSSTADPETISPTRTSVAVWKVSVKLHPPCEENVCAHAVAASRNRMAGLITWIIGSGKSHSQGRREGGSKELADQPAPFGAERHAHGDLPLPSRRSCQQQVRDVRASDQQYQTNDDHQYL